MIICKDCGKSVAPEECRNLKVNDPKETFGFRLDQLCEECYQKRLKETAEKPLFKPDEEVKPWGKSDVARIINQAMEHNDKQISIFIRGDVVSVDVRPYDVDDPRWIFKKWNDYQCSQCKQHSEDMFPYCPYCGESLRAVDDEEFPEYHKNETDGEVTEDV